VPGPLVCCKGGYDAACGTRFGKIKISAVIGIVTHPRKVREDGAPGCTKTGIKLQVLVQSPAYTAGSGCKICVLPSAGDFSDVRAKILISKSLSGGDLRLSLQNLEPMRLTPRISFWLLAASF
jgi:hypothetical protein